MTSLALTVDSSLARTVRFTGRLKQRHPARSPVASAVHGLDFLARGLFHVWRNRRYLTPLKLANMALIHLQYRLKTQRVLGRPYKMKIESTNICNTHCQLCPTGLGYHGRAKGCMTLEQFKGLIDQFRRTLFTVDLSMWGDPLIVPDIYAMIRHAHERGVWTYLSSNLHAFKPDKGHAEKLIQSGLDMITCSLHGASQETFGLYQPGKKFADALDKVRHLVETRRRLGSSTPVIQLNFVVTRHNEHEIEDFRRLAESLDCRPVFSQASLNLRFLGQDDKGVDLKLAPDVLQRKARQQMDQWLPRNQEFVLRAYQMLREGTYRHDLYNGGKLMDCSWPWKSAVINWDGTVCTCCGSWEAREDMGNALEQPFGKIWNNRRYQMARRSFKHRVQGQDCKDNPCANCPGFML